MPPASRSLVCLHVEPLCVTFGYSHQCPRGLVIRVRITRKGYACCYISLSTTCTCNRSDYPHTFPSHQCTITIVKHCNESRAYRKPSVRLVHLSPHLPNRSAAARPRGHAAIISEVHFHPPNRDGPDSYGKCLDPRSGTPYQFIELHNPHDGPAYLEGQVLTAAGLRFPVVFGPEHYIPPMVRFNYVCHGSYCIA